MNKIDRDMVKKWAVDIVSQVVPDDTFVIEEGFDEIADEWFHAVSQDEGRFIGGEEVAAFAGVVVPFLLGFFGDIAKDVAKEKARKSFGVLLDKLLNRRASSDETSKLKAELFDSITRSRFPDQEKSVLIEGFDELFAKIKPK